MFAVFCFQGKRVAYVTLATNDSYSFGALVLSQSLRKVCTARQLVVLVTPEVSQEMRYSFIYFKKFLNSPVKQSDSQLFS